MSDPFLISHLKNLPLFARLTQPQVSLIAEIVQVHRLEPGTLALQEGQPSTGMIVFVSGRGLLTRRRGDGFEEQIAAVGGGQFLNEASLYEARLETVSLRIVESAVVLFIPRDPFARVIGRHAEIRANLRIPGSSHPAGAGQSAPPAQPQPAAPARPPVQPIAQSTPPANTVSRPA
ncbi:MAG: cyclic nucleotide-binding domain-containing protein, partial [Anaerolineae bacterium]|nr:cyclic nucleotide-binding domain-containing protein [Anaerolineae bacterium]